MNTLDRKSSLGPLAAGISGLASVRSSDDLAPEARHSGTALYFAPNRESSSRPGFMQSGATHFIHRGTNDTTQSPSGS